MIRESSPRRPESKPPGPPITSLYSTGSDSSPEISMRQQQKTKRELADFGSPSEGDLISEYFQLVQNVPLPAPPQLPTKSQQEQTKENSETNISPISDLHEPVKEENKGNSKARKIPVSEYFPHQTAKTGKYPVSDYLPNENAKTAKFPVSDYLPHEGLPTSCYGMYTPTMISAPKNGKRKSEPIEAPSSSSSESDEAGNYWNEEFQVCLTDLNQISDKEKYSNLQHLARDFISVAERYGRIIISEKFLREDSRTIQPSKDLGGIAGGLKFICQGILFKFALDAQLGPGYWLYGGDKPNDEKAMKAACNELKGLSSCFECRIEGLCYPLMALIHYQVSVLPISETSLIYGSQDAGQTVSNSNPEFNTIMTHIAEQLGLASHSVKGTTIYGPGDIEGHLGEDQRFYLLDFGRLMPPEAPLGTHTRPGQPVFYDLLRSSLVLKYSKETNTRLCSDAFTLWIKSDPNWKNMENEVLQATKYIYTSVIPVVVKELQENRKVDLISFIHLNGLNCRHLGWLRRHENMKSIDLKKIILSEIIARVLKNEFRRVLRKTAKNQRIHLEKPFFDATFDFLENKLTSMERFPFFESISTKYKGNIETANQAHTIWSSYPLHKNAKTFYFEVTLMKGSVSIGFGNPRTQTKYFEYSSNGSFTTLKEQTQLLSTSLGETIGMFFDQNSLLCVMTKGNEVISDRIPLGVNKEAFFPFILTENNSSISFRIVRKPKDYSKLKFGGLELFCKTLDMGEPIFLINQEAKIFWSFKNLLKSMTNERFPKSLLKEEKSELFDLRESISMKLLIERFTEMSGVVLKQIEFNEDLGISFSLNTGDILRLDSRVSHIRVVDYAESVTTLFTVEEQTKKSYFLKELKGANKKINEFLLSSVLKHAQDYEFQARILLQIALATQNKEKILEVLSEAKKILVYALQIEQKQQSFENKIGVFRRKSSIVGGPKKKTIGDAHQLELFHSILYHIGFCEFYNLFVILNWSDPKHAMIWDNSPIDEFRRLWFMDPKFMLKKMKLTISNVNHYTHNLLRVMVDSIDTFTKSESLSEATLLLFNYSCSEFPKIQFDKTENQKRILRFREMIHHANFCNERLEAYVKRELETIVNGDKLQLLLESFVYENSPVQTLLENQLELKVFGIRLTHFPASLENEIENHSLQLIKSEKARQVLERVKNIRDFGIISDTSILKTIKKEGYRGIKVEELELQTGVLKHKAYSITKPDITSKQILFLKEFCLDNGIKLEKICPKFIGKEKLLGLLLPKTFVFEGNYKLFWTEFYEEHSNLTHWKKIFCLSLVDAFIALAELNVVIKDPNEFFIDESTYEAKFFDILSVRRNLDVDGEHACHKLIFFDIMEKIEFREDIFAHKLFSTSPTWEKLKEEINNDWEDIIRLKPKAASRPYMDPNTEYSPPDSKKKNSSDPEKLLVQKKSDDSFEATIRRFTLSDPEHTPVALRKKHSVEVGEFGPKITFPSELNSSSNSNSTKRSKFSEREKERREEKQNPTVMERFTTSWKATRKPKEPSRTFTTSKESNTRSTSAKSSLNNSSTNNTPELLFRSSNFSPRPPTPLPSTSNFSKLPLRPLGIEKDVLDNSFEKLFKHFFEERRQDSKKKDEPIKVCMLGTTGCGLTSAVNQFVSNQFSEEWEPTIEDRVRKPIVLKGRSTGNFALSLDILDTTGKEDYFEMRKHWILDSEAFVVMYSVHDFTFQYFEMRKHWILDSETFVVMYSVHDFTSFLNIQSSFAASLVSHKGCEIWDIPIVLVANKIDLPSKRFVTTQEGTDLAKKWGCPYLESSCKERTNIDEIFHGTIVQLALKTEQEKIFCEVPTNFVEIFKNALSSCFVRVIPLNDKRAAISQQRFVFLPFSLTKKSSLQQAKNMMKKIQSTADSIHFIFLGLHSLHAKIILENKKSFTPFLPIEALKRISQLLSASDMKSFLQTNHSNFVFLNHVNFNLNLEVSTEFEDLITEKEIHLFKKKYQFISIEGIQELNKVTKFLPKNDRERKNPTPKES